MQAIILAAGMGKRLKELTQNNTKCMVMVNSVTLIERMLRQLDKHNLSRIVIVIGYEGQKLVEYISSLKNLKTPIIYVNNSVYDKTNNIYSLALAQEYLVEEDTLLLESDLIFEDKIIDLLLEDSRPSLALVDKYKNWMDGTCVKLDEKNDLITAFVPGKNFKYDEKDEYYKTVNIYKFSKEFSKTSYVPFLNAYISALGKSEYYEQVLRIITMLDNPEIKAKRLNGELWYEIDDIQDLDIASSMFCPDENKKVAALRRRYGGYWRYPNLTDFCYLVNPYFPCQKLIDEIKSNFETLLTQYPSGIEVNSLLAAKNFGVRQENIVVGNGAAELIKSFMENIDGKTGIIRPTFEEYPNRYDMDKIVEFVPANENYSYTADDLISFFEEKEIETLIVVNPDNPSGNYIPKNDILKLTNWAAFKNIRLVIDESFVDFSDSEDSSIITQKIIDEHKNLFIVKSISKSYGVPGIRLGILASGDTKTIAYIKKDIAIWNINSFGEFYMQIAEKYKNDYAEALRLFKKERMRFEVELNTITGLRVIPSQANYFMIELTGKITAKELTKKLLLNHNLYIKDLSSKTGNKQYIRIAIRDTYDNNRLVEAMKTEIY